MWDTQNDFRLLETRHLRSNHNTQQNTTLMLNPALRWLNTIYCGFGDY